MGWSRRGGSVLSMRRSTSTGRGLNLALYRLVSQALGRWQFVALLVSLSLVIIYLVCRSWALHYSSGTWTYLGYVEQLLTGGYPPGHIWYAGLPTEWPSFSVWYLFLAGLTRITSLSSVDIWVLLPVLLIPLGFFCQFLWIRSLTHNVTAALLGACASFWFLDVWMLLSGPSTRFVAFYILAPLALLCLFRAFGKSNAWWAWAVIGGLCFGLMIQVHTLFALQLSMLILLFSIFLFIFRSHSIITEIKALSVFALVSVFTGGYRLLTLLFDSGRTLPLNSFYTDTLFWNTTVGPFEILNPDRYLWLLSPYYYGVALLLVVIGWVLILRQWRSRRYLVAWISSLVLLCVLIYLTPLGILLGRVITPGVVSEIFITSNLLPFGLALGIASVELANIAVGAIRRVCERFGFSRPMRFLSPRACLLVALALFVVSSVTPLQFYLGKMQSPAISGEDFLGTSVIQYLKQETDVDAIILSDPRTSHVIPALTHRKVMVADRNFILHNYDQRLVDAGRVVDPDTTISESLDILRRYDVELILLNPRFWNSARDQHNEQFKYGFDFPNSMSVVIQKFEYDDRFIRKTFDDGTVIFGVPSD